VSKLSMDVSELFSFESNRYEVGMFTYKTYNILYVEGNEPF